MRQTIINTIEKAFIVFCKVFIVVGILSYVFICGYIAHVYYKYRDTKVITINEGLGNQLYQVAFGYIFHKRTGKRVLFLDGISNHDERPWVKLWPEYFDTKIDFFGPSELERGIIKRLLVKKEDLFVDLNSRTLEEILEDL